MSEAPDDRNERDLTMLAVDEFPDVPNQSSAGPHQVDLDEIGRDLAAVEIALTRLDDGSYFTDEVTGELIPDDVLASHPLARRVG